MLAAFWRNKVEYNTWEHNLTLFAIFCRGNMQSELSYNVLDMFIVFDQYETLSLVAD